ncbi:MAG: hypothetical protein WB498_17520 [Candidatus Binatus sp.]
MGTFDTIAEERRTDLRHRDRLQPGGGIDYPQAGKISTVKTPIAGQEPIGGDQGVSADQKIGRDPVARASTCSVPAPSLRRLDRRLFSHRQKRGGLVHGIPKTSSVAKHRI